MTRGESQGLFALLKQLGIPYRAVSHPPAWGMDDLPPIEEALSAVFCKNLFLTNRQKTEYVLLLVRGDKRFRTAEVSRKLERPRLSFGDEDMLWQLLGLKPGGVSPLGLIFDEGHRLALVIDRDLLGQAEIAMHIGDNTESIAMKTSDLLETYIPHCGHKPIYLDITGEVPHG